MKKFLWNFFSARHGLKLFAVAGFFIFHLSLCQAQDTLACKNGKKIVGKVLSVGKDKVTYIVPPDSTPRFIANWRMDYISYPGGTKFNFTERKKSHMPSLTSLYISAELGASIPAAKYKDGIVGNDFAAKATFYVSRHVGFVAKAALDLNGTGLNYISNDYWGGFYIFQQYLAGLTYRTGGKPGYPWIDFVALGGFCKAASPVYEVGGGYTPLTVYTPGTGTGVGYYFGINFTSSADHLCSLTFGAGCLGAIFSYPDFTSTISEYHPITKLTGYTESDGVSKMGLALFQVYLGINFRAKKAGR
jgi:hypothetical protein